MKKLVSVLLAGVMCASLLTACGGSSSTGSSNTSATAAGGTESTQTAAGKTTINIGVKSDLTSLDPHNHNDTISAYATRHIYNNLVKLTADNEFVGNLAESWEFKDDVTVEFTLKEGIKFHNGDTLTSEDVKFSLERQKESPKIGHLVSMIDNVEVVDDTHFIIHMNTPSNALISSLNHSGCAILDKSYTEALEAEGKTLESAPMGCGPYKFEEWIPGASFTLVKFDDYFDPETAAQNDKLVFKVIPEEAARTIALENGELDLIVDANTTDAQRIRDNASLALDECVSTHVEYLAMNTQKAPFDNKLVRQALNHAIKKDDIVIAAIDGEGEAFDNYIGKAAIGYYDTAVKYDYNPEKAKELLAEAGYPNGFTFTCYLAGEIRARSATIVQANLAEIGITMNIEQMEASTFYEKTGKGEHDACLAGWVANAEPDNTYRPLFTSEKAGAGGNRAFYKNPEVDKLVDDAATNRDSAAVQKDYETILHTVSDDAIWVPLYSKKGLCGRNKDLQGFTISPISMHDFYSLHY
ncbi:MAG: ABC transporter substrate-binding protein [Lachnospiraceae bacterium]|nr:ABC transporter substrate-binding protein [Lachnospiraceae bacterium]